MAHKALVIGGFPASGAGGIPVDLRVLQHLGVYGMGAVTCLVSRGTRGESEIFPIPHKQVENQLRAALLAASPGGIKAIKVGLLATDENLHSVAGVLREKINCLPSPPPLVLDPVMFFKAGAVTVNKAEVATLLSETLLPLATVVTPNLEEARALLGAPEKSIWGTEEMLAAAWNLAEKTSGKSALVKGGLRFPGDDAVDVLVTENREYIWRAPKIGQQPLNGSGCTLAAAITAHLANGSELVEAVEKARNLVRQSLEKPQQMGTKFNALTLP
ncbi:hydroxymethylpyrimidine/phosphomethylpyrimidine kinase [Actinomycetaceae bacterium TAE3-ERU4]|nr:hydroxymethylpyrimidine/phosphomethylpyrimidine kinase [Actinomycetaceae bacterium TAE3-ERU4]